jgi:hypothetical protein
MGNKFNHTKKSKERLPVGRQDLGLEIILATTRIGVVHTANIGEFYECTIRTITSHAISCHTLQPPYMQIVELRLYSGYR